MNNSLISIYLFILVCKPLPGSEIIGWSFFREPGIRQLRCVELFKLQNQHSISQSVHKFGLSEGMH